MISIMYAIEVKDLRKQFRVQKNREGLAGALRDLFNREYREVTAVKDISFQIPQGEICGYIGENGAGKSTTIKMLTGILVPTSGHLKVNGFVPYKEREKFVSGIGVVFGQRSQLWWDIGVIESFQLLRKVYRVPEAEYRKRLDELVERLQLGDLLNRPVRKLSLGQRMRCELVASLLHNPSILFLDEPTIGLDIVVKTEIREFLKQLNREHGTTILLTTHDLQDIEALCSRVIMLDDGKIIYDGGLEELKSRWSKGREIQFQFAGHYSLKRMEELTAGLEGVSWRPENELTAVMWLPHSVNVSDALSRVVGAAEIRDIKIFETNTDEIVREIYSSGSASAPAQTADSPDKSGEEPADGESGGERQSDGGPLQAGGAGAVPRPQEALAAAGSGMTEPGESGALEAGESGAPEADTGGASEDGAGDGPEAGGRGGSAASGNDAPQTGGSADPEESASVVPGKDAVKRG